MTRAMTSRAPVFSALVASSLLLLLRLLFLSLPLVVSNMYYEFSRHATRA